MTPAEYARAKEVFTKAIEIPDQDRAIFVRQQCGDNPRVAGEVLSLLEHHLEATLLEPPTQKSTRDAIAVSPPQPVDPYLVLKDVWEDNRQILRRRLLAISVVMAVLIALSTLRLFTNLYAAWGYGGRIFALGVSLTCAWTLHRRRDLTLSQIHFAEFAVMGSAGLLAIVISLRTMVDAAIRQDVATLISAHNWNFFVWALIILVYGVFMPNHWQRAAMILTPVAMLPAVVTWFADRLNPQVGILMEQDDFGMPLPVTVIAAGIAIYAAHLIHGARVSAFQAKRLAQYQIKRLIGEGGMGQVFEAEHLLLKRSCAIKVIQPEFCADDHARERFQNEVRATAQLTHPHTIEVYDYGQTTDGFFFFSMELLPGINLRELVETSGPLPPARAVHFLVQVCEALAEAHRAGLIHRDIKPANIYASQRGGIHDFTKLLDFGLAGEVHVDLEQKTAPNMIAGTPAYMSPEQVASPDRVDARSDIYSLGAVAYYLLTGRPPFVGDSPIDVMLAQVNRQPDPPSSHRAEIPPDLESLIMRCLAKNVDQRIASAEQLRRELLACEVASRWGEEDAAASWHALGLVDTPSVPENAVKAGA